MHAAAGILGFGVISPRAGPVFEIAQRLDGRGLTEITHRFEPAFAPGLYAALGPTPVPYAALVIVTLLAALIARWRGLPLTAVKLFLTAALALEVAWAIGVMAGRPGPLVVEPGLPVPPEWRQAWQPFGSFPNRHTLVCAALAGTLARTWLPLTVAGFPIALGAGATAIFFGAARISDVVAGLVLGVAVAEAVHSVLRSKCRAS